MTTPSPLFNFAQRLESIWPKPSNYSLLCHAIPVQVSSGDDVQILLGESVHICCVINVWLDVSPPNFLVKLWLQELKFPPGINLQLLNPSLEGKLIGICGVLHTNWLRQVSPEEIKDFAYIFHHKDILSRKYASTYGRKNDCFCQIWIILCVQQCALGKRI